MARSSPETETMAFTDARQHLSQVVNEVARGERRVLIEKSGVPVAALVSAADLRLLIELEAQREARFAAIQRISDAFADVPVDELEQQVARALSDARADLLHAQEADSHP